MIKVMTLNLNCFGDKHGSWETRLAHLEHVVRRHAPDVAVFQAVCGIPSVADGLDQAQQVALRLGDYRHVWFEPALVDADDKRQGSAFIARGPFTPVGHQELPLEDDPEDNHRRILLHARMQKNGTPLEIVNAHFSWVERVNRSNVAAALNYVRGLTGAVMLAGDLNATPDGPGMRQLADAGWTDAWARLRGDDPGPTFEADAPDRRIDYVWLNPPAAERLRAIERVVPEGGARLSDHLGLLVVLE